MIDTLRADHLGIYGYSRPTSPALDCLGAEGLVFTNAIAPSSWTKPSIGSLFTSRLPSQHGAVSFEQGLAPALPTLAELLGDAGYYTLGVSGNFLHVNEGTGLERGFERWHTVSAIADGGTRHDWEARSAEGKPISLADPPARLVNRRVLGLLPEPGTAPLFLYVHYMEPHSPYVPPEPFRSAFVRDRATHAAARPATSGYLLELAGRGVEVTEGERRRLIDLYDAEIATADHAVGELVAELTQRGFGEDTVYVVASDHGEEFGEHRGWFHGFTLHRESLGVPLLIHDARGLVPRGRRDDPVDLLDVPTTLLGLAGIEAPPAMLGRDLLAGSPLAARDLVAELHRDDTFEARVRPKRRHRLALTRWPWKAIVDRHGGASLYQLELDPAEAQRVAPEGAAAPPAFATEVLALERQLAEAVSPPPAAAVPEPQVLEALRALGYAE